MKYIYRKSYYGYNCHGHLIAYHSVTETITVFSSIQNICFLLGINFAKKTWFILWISDYRIKSKTINKYKMFSQITKNAKGFKEIVDSITNNSTDTSQKSNEMIVDVPPPVEHLDTSLMENAINLGRRSERLITSNLLLVGGIPSNYNHTTLTNAIIFIAKIVNQIHELAINISDLEQNLLSRSKEQIILYNDNLTCSFTIPLSQEYIFALGGHNPFPPAFGYCTSADFDFAFTCQALPIPSTHETLKSGLELAIFSGVSMNDHLAQCTLALVIDRFETYYAQRLGLPMDAFDFILHRRSCPELIHDGKKADMNGIGIHVRKSNDTALATLKMIMGLLQGPNPVSFNWRGDAWEDLAGLRVQSPSNILLDRTPSTYIGTFHTREMSIVDLVQCLILDNPMFPLHAAIIIWVQKIDADSCALGVIWDLKHHTINIGNNLRFANSGGDLFATIHAYDDPNMTEVRLQTAGAIAHFKILRQKPFCDWHDNRIKKEWKELRDKLLRTTPATKSPLKTNPHDSSVPIHVPPVTAIVPATELAIRATTPSQLVTRVPPPIPRPCIPMSVVPHQPTINLEALIAQAVAKEVGRHVEESYKREQALEAKIEALGQAQTVANIATTESLQHSTLVMNSILELTAQVRELTSRMPSHNPLHLPQWAAERPPIPSYSQPETLDAHGTANQNANEPHARTDTPSPMQAFPPPSGLWTCPPNYWGYQPSSPAPSIQGLPPANSNQYHHNTNLANHSMQQQPDDSSLQRENWVTDPPLSNE